MPEKREDVEATPQQDTAPDISQQKRKWRSIDWIAGGTFIAEVLWGSWWLVTQVFHWCSWNPRVSTEHFAQFYCGVGLGILSVGYLVLILWPIIFNIFKQGRDSKQDNDPRWFHARILSSGIVGGSYAFLLPAVMSLPEGGVNSGGAAALRQAILLATGGLIGLIALGETRRKNDNDREAAEKIWVHQQDTLDQQKDHFEKQLEKQQEQYEANAFKERKAERRERYTKAVEQLGDEKAPIRMGGVYTLVGLVDEWLEEENLSETERLKEGQVIINNLCAYIRSPFTLVSQYDELSKNSPTPKGLYKDKEQEFYTDKAKLESEADVRLSVIKEIHDRVQKTSDNTEGIWSNFEYDFSDSTFFYPVDFSYSHWNKSVNFSGSTYHSHVNFSGSTYKSKINFSMSIYRKDAIFSTDDSQSAYHGQVNFSLSTYQGEATFEGSEYKKDTLFKESIYGGCADFSRSVYGHENEEINYNQTDFTNSIYKSVVNFSHSEYNLYANFSKSIYCNLALFNDSVYSDKSCLENSIYNKQVAIYNTIYNNTTTFGGSIFCTPINFSYFTDEYDNEYNPPEFKENLPSFFYENNPYEPEFEKLEELYTRKGNSALISRAIFYEKNNNFEISQGEGRVLEKNSDNLPRYCAFIKSTQREHIENEFKKIIGIYNELLNSNSSKETKDNLNKLKCIANHFHEWRKKETLSEKPYDFHEAFGNITENLE